MRTHSVFAIILCALASPAAASIPTLHQRTLPNGLRLAYLHIKESNHIAIFTFLPIGLAFDDADHAQWSHLLEHLIIRTTVPPGQPLTTINAETLPDHMHLDFYDKKDNWRIGLDHHVKWLSNLPISDEAVRVEPQKANREADNTARVMYSHKFAVAAWDQICRQSRTHAAIKGDLLKATRADLESYRAARLPRPDQTFVCIVGGIDPDTLLTTAAKSLSAIPAPQPARAPATAPAAALPIMKPQTHAATWDLAARHLMLTWPIPSCADDLRTQAALTTLTRLLMFQLAQDAELQKQLGPILVAADLACPESNYFSISAALRPGSDFTAARTAILNRLAALATANNSPIPLEQLSPLLVQELDLHDAAELRAQVPAQMTDGMIEAQLALTWATSEYRFRPHRTDLQNALRAVTFDQIQQSIAKRLTPDQCTTLQLSPKD